MNLGISLSLAHIPLIRAMPLAALAERNGFTTVSVGEAAHDSFAAATAMAIATSSVRIMTGVTTWVRPPILTATAAATVDEISGGRFTLGLGTMPEHWNRDHYGVDPSKPLERMREYVSVVRQSLACAPGSPLDFSGQRFQVRGHRRASAPVRSDIPIVLAATRAGMARLAGSIADGVYLNVIHTADGVRNFLLPAVGRGLEESGREVESCERILMLRCSISDDAELAWFQLRNSLRMYLGVPYLVDVAAGAGFDISGAIAMAQQGKVDEALRALPIELIQQMGVAGTVEQCAKQLARYHGLVDTIVFAPPSGLGADDGIEQISRILSANWPRPTATSPSLAPEFSRVS